MYFFHDAIGSQYVNTKTNHLFYNVLHSQMPYSVSFSLLCDFNWFLREHGAACMSMTVRVKEKERKVERNCLHCIRRLQDNWKTKSFITSLHLSSGANFIVLPSQSI